MLLRQQILSISQRFIPTGYSETFTTQLLHLTLSSDLSLDHINQTLFQYK